MDFSRTMAGIIKWFWGTEKGSLSYILEFYPSLKL